MNELLNEIETLNKKALSLKTKTAKTKVYDKIRTLENKLHEIALNQCEELNKKYENKKVQALVKKDSRNGQTMIFISEFNATCFLSNNNDVLSKSWYEETCCIEYKEGQTIELVVIFEVPYSHRPKDIKPCFTILKQYGGHVNETQYSKLCNDSRKYAFFKYPNKELTGLFA